MVLLAPTFDAEDLLSRYVRHLDMLEKIIDSTECDVTRNALTGVHSYLVDDYGDFKSFLLPDVA